MARGKYAVRAEIKRDRTELVVAAESAQHRADRLEGEVADLRALHDRETRALRAALSTAERQRDEAISPRVTALADELLALREQVARATKETAYERKVREKTVVYLLDVVGQECGAKDAEIGEAVLRLHLHTPLVRSPGVRPLPSATLQRAYERVKGQRTSATAGNDKLDQWVQLAYANYPVLIHAILMTLMASMFGDNLYMMQGDDSAAGGVS